MDDDYQVVWLSVERDLDAKLRSPELLKHGAYMKLLYVLSSLQCSFGYQGEWELIGRIPFHL